MKRAATFCWLALAVPLWAQEVKLPAEVKVEKGRLGAVTIDWSGSALKWTAPDDIDIFREYEQDTTKVRLRFIGYKTGRYKLSAIAAKGDKLSDFAHCILIVGDPGPDPGPGPDPKPPDPVPPPGVGKRVLILYESAEASKLPERQQQVLYSRIPRDFLNAKCEADQDGKTRAWRIWDKDVDASAEHRLWQDALKRERKSLPWIVITDSAGKAVHEGALPADVEATMTLLKKHLGG